MSNKEKNASETRKAYTTKMIPRSHDRMKLLGNFMDYLMDGTPIFFELWNQFGGGIDRDIISGTANKDKISDDLLLAVNWFKVMPINSKPQGVSPSNLANLFQQYSGSEPDIQAQEYFASNFDTEKHQWKDMRVEYERLLAELQLSRSDMHHDLKLMYKEKCIGLSLSTAHYITSVMFGTGAKNNRQTKHQFYSKVIQLLEESTQINSVEQLASIILKAGDCDSYRKLRIRCSRKGATPSILKIVQDYELGTNHDDEVNVPSLIANLKEKLGRFEYECEWKCMEKIKAFLASKVGPYYLGSYSAMLENALSPIKGMTTKNCKFVLKQIDAKNDIKYENEPFGKIVEGFFDSPYFESDTNVKWVLHPHHIGESNIKTLWEDLNAIHSKYEEDIASLSEDKKEKRIKVYQGDVCQTINTYCEEVGKEAKTPLVQLLRYLYSRKDDIAVDKIIDGITFLSKKHKVEKQKINPVIQKYPSFNFGNNSKLLGKIISPKDKLKHNLKCNRNQVDNYIWIEIKVLNTKTMRWEKHHYALSSTRFLEEVYYPATSENPPDALAARFRTKTNGYEGKPALSAEQIEQIRSAPVGLRKVKKRQMRLEAARQQNLLPRYTWGKDFNINICKRGNNFEVTLATKVKKKKEKNYKVVLGYDANIVRKNTYAAIEAHANGDGVIDYNDLPVKPIESGFVTVESQVRDKSYDQLSYNGVKLLYCKPHVESRRSFLEKYRNGTMKDNRGNNIQIDFMKDFEAIADDETSLYYFNMKYCKLLQSSIRNHSSQAKEYREEIFELLRDGKLSVLKLSSLSNLSFVMFKVAKSLIGTYFGHLLKKPKNSKSDVKAPPITDEDKQKADPEMFALRLALEEKRLNKVKSKKEVIANKIVAKALELRDKYGPVLIKGENISDTTKKGKKSSTNSFLMDWLARGVANKVKEMVMMHQGLEFVEVNPNFTSHQDPFVHKNPENTFRARYSRCTPSELTEKNRKEILSFLSDKPSKRPTNAYYNEGAMAFLATYGLKKNDVLGVSLEKFKQIMANILHQRSEDQLLFPSRGGMFYLATYKLDADATSVNWNGKQFWVCNADLVAAYNVGLVDIQKDFKKKLEHHHHHH
uniref:12i1-WT n=2 Tax=Lachnospiraceae bacterium ND2006 TaxID=1410628 RepID=UPI001BB46FE9|nr:Chain A, 12i1-WT [Lachnospiraceae bacterium ND2006]